MMKWILSSREHIVATVIIAILTIVVCLQSIAIKELREDLNWANSQASEALERSESLKSDVDDLQYRVDNVEGRISDIETDVRNTSYNPYHDPFFY